MQLLAQEWPEARRLLGPARNDGVDEPFEKGEECLQGVTANRVQDENASGRQGWPTVRSRQVNTHKPGLWRGRLRSGETRAASELLVALRIADSEKGKERFCAFGTRCAA